MTSIKQLIYCIYTLCLIFTSTIFAATNNELLKENLLCPSAIINAFTPSNGPENTLITISGSNFSTAASVTIDGIATTFTIIDDSQITALVPAGVSSSSSISIISTGGCTGTSASDFTLIATDCSSADIYISEIYDASTGDYAVIELYNPTNSPVVIDGTYVIIRYGDVGNATPNNTFSDIIGTIPPMDTFVIQMGTGTNCSPLDVDFNIPTGINDNDEFELLNNGVLIDIVNAPDERGYTVIRNADAPIPQTTYDINDWDINSSEDCSDLGTHTADPITNNLPELIDPITQTICENGNVTFTTSLNNSIFQYQWKVLDASGNWIDVPNSSPYSNPQNSSLDITSAPSSFNGNQYYCEVTYNGCPLITNTAQVNIDNPEVDSLTDQTVCTEYILPTLINGNYFTGTGGSGTALNAGDAISSIQTIYIYSAIGTAPNICDNETSFDVTVSTTPAVDTISDQTVCTEYVLPVLTNGNYFTGTDGSGTALNAGDAISSTQTIYIYNAIGIAPNICDNETSFDVTVSTTPAVDNIADQTVCAEYILPTLTNGNYFTGTDGSGTALNAGDAISSSQTIYIYNEIGTTPNICFSESNFDIEINPTLDFSLDESNISINTNTISISMTDTSIDYEYAIDNSIFQTSNTFSNLTEGAHTLEVRDRNGCVLKSLNFEITVAVELFIPVFFTPNNDTVNDSWTVVDPNNIVEEILIFNRYGKLIKQLIPSNYSWDGYYNGKVLESNDFWYLITLKNAKQLKGHFALKH